VQIASGTLLSGLLTGLPLKSDAKTPEVVKLDSGLEYVDEKIGQGSSPRAGDLVIIVRPSFPRKYLAHDALLS